MVERRPAPVGSPPRETLLSDIVILAPVIARLAGEPGLVRAAEAIEDASSWLSAQPA